MDQNELRKTLARLGITDTEHNIRIDPGSGKIQRETYLNWEDTGYRIEPGTGKVQKDAWTHWEETGYRIDPGSGKIQKDAWTHWEETGHRVDPESGKIQEDAWTHWSDSGHRVEPDTGKVQRERWPGWEDSGAPRDAASRSEGGDRISHADYSSSSYSSTSLDYSASDYSSGGGSSSESSSKSGLGVIGRIFLIIILVGAAYFFFRRPSGSQITGASSSLPGVAYVNTKQLNVRERPGSEHNSISKLPLGTQVSTLQRAQSTDGGTWVKVRQGSIEGWVNEKLLSYTQVPLDTATSQGIKIGLVDNSQGQYQDGCGCSFCPIDKDPQFNNLQTQGCILIGNYEKQAWMNIDDQIVQLRLVQNTAKYQGNVGDKYYQSYQADNISVTIECVATGFGDTHAVHCDASITVVKNDQKQTVKAEGSCGC